MNCVDLYVRKYPSDPDPSRSRKKKLPLIQHIVESWQYKLTEQQRQTSVRSFYLHKDDIREETSAYPVVDDAHQHEPVR